MKLRLHDDERKIGMMMRARTLTLVLVNLAGIMESADESLLPGVYKEVGAALHTDPTGLGSLTLFRSIVQSSCYPLAACLAIRYNRPHVIALGATLWAAATFLVAISSTFFQVAVSRGLNGIGLAIVIPAIQSLVADSTVEANRGMAFGWLQLTGNIGSIIGGLCSVLMASTSFMGIPGWRMAFHLVALISIVVGILVGIFASDPRFSNKQRTSEAQIPREPLWSELKNFVKEAKSVLNIPSFQVIVAQGIAGSFGGSALSFVPMWLELVGFSHKTVALLWTLFIVGFSLGGLFGGRMGDILAQRYPNSGRIILSQISSGSVIPLAAVLLQLLPYDPSTALMHGFILFAMGFNMSWNAPATNNPIFAEIVPERCRTTIYALDQSLESMLSSFAPPLVGILAQHVFGYKPVQKGSADSEEIEADRENAASLAKALYSAMGIPYLICCLIYSLLYCTYPRDKERARMDALIESENQWIVNPRLQAEYSQLHVLESNKMENKETGVLARESEGEERLDFDENVTKKLISHELAPLNSGNND